jgi:hypothetical protein
MYFGNVTPTLTGRRGRATRHARRSPSMMPDADHITATLPPGMQRPRNILEGVARRSRWRRHRRVVSMKSFPSS